MNPPNPMSCRNSRNANQVQRNAVQQHYSRNVSFGQNHSVRVPDNVSTAASRPPARASHQLESLKRWNIKFDGSRHGLPVEEFLFRVESLAIADGVDQSALAAHVHEFLTGKALNWYWLYRRTAPLSNWMQLRDALLDEFCSQETDYEVRQAMHSRTQRPNEPFSDYRLAMQSLASRLRIPMSNEELIEIVRRNMNSRLLLLLHVTCLLLLHDVVSLDQLRDLARKFEKLWAETDTRSRSRFISEVYPAYNSSLFNAISQEPSTNISQVVKARERSPVYPVSSPPEVVNDNKVVNVVKNVNSSNEEICAVERSRVAYENLVCWNCDKKGHSFRSCTVEQRSLFCYKCGAKGVRTPLCRNCSTENDVSNGTNSGSLRSRHRFPDPSSKKQAEMGAKKDQK